MSYRFVDRFRAGPERNCSSGQKGTAVPARMGLQFHPGPAWFYYKETPYDARTHERKIPKAYCDKPLISMVRFSYIPLQ